MSVSHDFVHAKNFLSITSIVFGIRLADHCSGTRSHYIAITERHQCNDVIQCRR